MTVEERQEIYRKLSEPFPPEAIERTDGRVTGRGYSTTGIKYQFVVNRLNEVLGIGCFRTHKETSIKEISTNSGRTAYEAWCDLVLELGEWKDGVFVVLAEALADGGHTSMSEPDARKGAYTNAFKKAAAFFGCGRQAYEGTIDDDNVPAEEQAEQRRVSQVPRAKASVRTEAAPEQQAVNGQARAAGSGRNGTRTRISAKQLAAIWAMARKLGQSQSHVRQRVKELYDLQPEFLNKTQASEVIQKLQAALERADASNGHAPNESMNGASHAAGG